MRSWQELFRYQGVHQRAFCQPPRLACHGLLLRIHGSRRDRTARRAANGPASAQAEFFPADLPQVARSSRLRPQRGRRERRRVDGRRRGRSRLGPNSLSAPARREHVLAQRKTSFQRHERTRPALGKLDSTSRNDLKLALDGTIST